MVCLDQMQNPPTEILPQTAKPADTADYQDERELKKWSSLIELLDTCRKNHTTSSEALVNSSYQL